MLYINSPEPFKNCPNFFVNERPCPMKVNKTQTFLQLDITPFCRFTEGNRIGFLSIPSVRFPISSAKRCPFSDRLPALARRTLSTASKEASPRRAPSGGTGQERGTVFCGCGVKERRHSGHVHCCDPKLPCKRPLHQSFLSKPHFSTLFAKKLSRTRIQHPCRSMFCRHIQCFDLFSYLQVVERSMSWKCPHCNAPAKYGQLFIDSSFKKYLAETSSSTDEIIIEADGTWKAPEVKASSSKRSHSDSEDEDSEEESFLQPPAKQAKPEPCVIDLTDDEEPGALQALQAMIFGSLPRPPMTQPRLVFTAPAPHTYRSHFISGPPIPQPQSQPQSQPQPQSQSQYIPVVSIESDGEE